MAPGANLELATARLYWFDRPIYRQPDLQVGVTGLVDISFARLLEASPRFD
jgi:hypothetical protein